LRKEIELMVEDEVKKALEIPPPPIEVIFEDVYSEIPWNLKEEMEEIIEDFRGG
jgi:TPP-dependent pyruvate/acetoin dehydrogenase alpha subunit